MLNFVTKILAADTEALNLNIDTSSGGTNIGDLLDKVIPFVSVAAGVVAFAFLIYSGFLYMTAGGNAESAKKGQAGILNAIIGLIIVALAYTITTALVGTLSGTSS